jgi:hypothetical protein
MIKGKVCLFTTLMFVVASFFLFLVFAGESQAAPTVKSLKDGCPGVYNTRVRATGYNELRDTRYRLKNYNNGRTITITGIDYYDPAGNLICSGGGLTLPIAIGPNQSMNLRPEDCVPIDSAGNFQAIITWESSGKGAGTPLEALWEIHVHDNNAASLEYFKTIARHGGKCTPLSQ